MYALREGSPLMDDPAQKNKSLPDAAKAFPKLVFQDWLKLRRAGADQFFPAWRKLPRCERRVQVLDLGAVLKARMN
jgi:hypothetical protein